MNCKTASLTVLKKVMVFFTGCMLCQTAPASAQAAVYGPVAEAMQTSAYNKFLSSDGKYFIHDNNGNLGFNYWWNAHGIDVLLDGYQRTRDNVYKQRMKNLLLGIKDKNGNTYINTFYDDMEWLGISSLRAYQNTNDIDYLNVANLLWQDIKGGIHPEQGGAIQWNKNSPNSFNACANSPAIIMAARLYRINGNAQDLQTAVNVYNWMKNKLVDPVNGAVWDGYNTGNNSTNTSWIFSYNVGTWIGAGLELYKVTGNQTYLNDAVKTAEYAMNNRLYNGVFWTNETGGADGGLFKGIFIRYFSLLATQGNIPQATRQRYVNALKTSADGMYQLGLNQSTLLVNPNWTQMGGTTGDYSTQLSGIMLMETATLLDQVMIHKDADYGGYSSCFKTGSYTKANMIAGGVSNDDITSFTVPEGMQITLFKDDNFSGVSMTKTSNTSWIGASWNDQVSSFIIGLQPVNGTGDGLTGSYFNGTNFELPVLSRNDTLISFNWGTASPGNGIAADSFSVRWAGKVQPGYSGIYTFYLNSDNGRRLWVNNQLLINKWTNDWGVQYTGSIDLNAGQQYDITLEYFEVNGGAGCNMEWSGLLQTREVVPKSQLYSNVLPSVNLTAPLPGQVFNAPATINLTANASDSDGNISRVDFYNGNQKLGGSPSSPYAFNWINVDTGAYAIRAIAYDDKGAVSFSAVTNITVQNNIITITDHQATASCFVYPNPASQTLYIHTDRAFTYTEIYTVDGLKVRQSQQATIDVSDLAPGIYQLQITLPDKRKIIKRFIKS